MIPLLLSILSSSLIYVVFKLLGKFKVDSLQAIVVNYMTACLIGVYGHFEITGLDTIFSESWFLGSVILGCLFIIVFNLMIVTAQRNGMSVVSVASKMSVALSIIFVIFYYNEEPGILKISGIILALIAVYLVSAKTKRGIDLKKSDMLFPFLVFIGSGIIESGIKFMETTYVAGNEVALFSATTFGTAACIGLVVIAIRYFINGKFFRGKDIIGGILLGIPNYFSIYYFILALRSEGMNSSTVFILNNILIVLFSTFLGILFFREKLLRKNWMGIALAIVSIILVALSTKF